MKKILYLSNIEVPYREDFFSQLAKVCDLTVLYERRNTLIRDDKWAKSGHSSYHKIYLDGIPIRTEDSFSIRIASEVRKGYDLVVIGSYNSPVQIFAMLIMMLLKIPFIINLDGEQFINNKGIKTKIKRFLLKRAKGYLQAGDKSTTTLRAAIRNSHPIFRYYLSSLKTADIQANAEKALPRDNTVAVIGQYFPYKGIDIALAVARRMTDVRFKFVGMGKRTNIFLSDNQDIPDNVEVIPFLHKKELELLYLTSAAMMLPSRQECWGLVVNEAASYGTPIVSTYGSGAAVEFLADEYPEYLAQPGDPASLEQALKRCLTSDNTEYSIYLKHKAAEYTIERSVRCHLQAFDGMTAHRHLH